MNGSEKQVKWASDIIEQTREQMQTKLSEARARHEHLAAKPELAERENTILAGREVAINLVLGKLDELSDAKYIIDNRGDLHVEILKTNMRNLPADQIAALQGVAQYVDRNQFYSFIFG